MVKGTHRGKVKDGAGAADSGSGVVAEASTSSAALAETSRTAAARRQPLRGVVRKGRQSPSALSVAVFLSKKGKLVRKKAGPSSSRRVRNASGHNRLGSVLADPCVQPHRFTLAELREITHDFSDEQLLGEGAFGKVYKGVLQNGDTIAVKRLKLTMAVIQDKQYENEARHLMRLKHPNIVQLVGYCSETEKKLVPYNGIFVYAEEFERLLCLEYLPKGNLRRHLSDEYSGLDWSTRYKIIEDFGLSRLFGEEQTRTCTRSCNGTPGYMAPEYIDKGIISKKLDIFSLGVIIIEIMTGHKEYPDETETSSQQYIELVLNKWRHRPRKAPGYTSGDIDYQQIKRCIQIGLLCVKFDQVKRPTIRQIIKMLDGTEGAEAECFDERKDDMDPRDNLGRCMDASKGFGFSDVAKARASYTKVVCCDFSSDGKLLATGGHDKKVVLWGTEPLRPKSVLEEHSFLITDVRFSPSMSRLATSSFDKTVRVWDADNTDYSLRTFTGHSASVMSLDFHPNKEDMICSCDSDGEVRSWSINNGSCLTCVKVFKGGATQMRFQPCKGKYLAVASDKTIYILDGVTQHACRNPLQGHNKLIQSLCWDSAGDYLASVTEDSARIWSFTSGHDGEFVHELNCSRNKFYSCVFHPTYLSLLVIGCYESLELWDIREKNTMTFNNAHEGTISALAASSATGKVASVSHDRFVKLWK
ncbi:hypothetical protein PVAP13_3NG251500 [Panicum virgatum]|uniref:Protein kinase domain-containing protein n=2 Tax=Panicum virgatum TaxID=38727 RepID=A0A8T0UGA5_PANVG|nr:hypothetical protein PVAP13_3NG251500 [Panicum virgatum]KAG2621393.1 hypothetical protein PVAP13_3NG251500 [Panicum virgatum]